MTEQEYMVHLEFAYNLLIGAEDAYTEDEQVYQDWKDWTEKTAGMLLKWHEEQEGA